MKSNATEKNNIQKLKDKIAELEKSLFTSKQMEKELRKSEELLRLITDNTTENLAITTFNLKPTYMYVNPSVKQVLGYDPEDLLGKSFFDFIHPDDKKVLFPLLIKYVNQKIKKIISGKKLPISATIEFRFKNKIGNWRFMQSTVNIAGKRFVSVTRDITERKQTEEALLKSEQELNAIFNGTRYGIVLLDKTGKILRINKYLVEIGGFTEEDIIGKRFNALKMFPLKSISKMITAFGKLIKGQAITYDVDVYTKKGEKKIVNINNSLLKKNGKVEGFIAILSDITERKQTEEKLISRNKELEIFNEVMVSRELKMLELKKEINELLEKSGEKPKYEIPI